MSTTLAIMQPTFLPWLGYFALMDSVDNFILLDDVQFSHQSYHNRNRIKTSQGPLIITVPCKRGKKLICDVEVTNISTYEKLIRSVEQSYSKTAYKEEVLTTIKSVFFRGPKMLANLNCQLIEAIASLLGINTNLVRSSEFSVPKMEKRIRLLKFCEELNAKEYLSVPGTLSYLKEDNPFIGSGIQLKIFSFEHPTYPQLHGPFEPYLSTIDAIANIGKEKTKELLRSSTKPSVDFNQAVKLHLK